MPPIPVLSGVRNWDAGMVANGKKRPFLKLRRFLIPSYLVLT
jgi:hypothetical protein